MKVCFACKVEKDDSCFNKDKTRKDGLSCYCRDCSNKMQTDRRRSLGQKEQRPRTIDELPAEKRCTKCQLVKPKSEFRIRLKKGYVFINPSCLDCELIKSKEYYASKKNDEEFKKKNKERQKIYAEKNPDKVRALNQRESTKRKKRECENKRYSKMKDVIAAKMKVKRQTPEYKQKMREYRQQNKDKIYEQEVVTKKRYHDKHRDAVTDEYCAHQLRQQGVKNITPELIEWKRGQILIARVKKKLSEMQVGQTKVCNCCKKEQDLSEFYVIKNKNRRAATCRSCNSEKCKLYREKKKNEKKILISTCLKRLKGFQKQHQRQ